VLIVLFSADCSPVDCFDTTAVNPLMGQPDISAVIVYGAIISPSIPFQGFTVEFGPYFITHVDFSFVTLPSMCRSVVLLSKFVPLDQRSAD